MHVWTLPKNKVYGYVPDILLEQMTSIHDQ